MYPIVRLAFYDSWVTRGGKSLRTSALSTGQNTEIQVVVVYGCLYSFISSVCLFKFHAKRPPGSFFTANFFDRDQKYSDDRDVLQK